MSFIFIPAVPNSEIELEDGLGNLQLESGDALILESSNPVAEGAIQVLDEVPVLPIPYVYKHESFFYQAGDPDESTEPRYHEAWQNLSTTTPVMREPADVFGRRYGFEYFFIQLSTPTFLPDGTGVVGPTSTEEVFPSRTTTEPE